MTAPGRPPLAIANPEAPEYQPGTCNIGPAEVAVRRRSGHLGVVAAIGLFAVLVAVGAPPLARLLVAVPAAGAASGYLQARSRFCANFGWRGLTNFGALGAETRVEDAEARARDRAKAARIGAISLVIGVAAGVVAVLLPI